MKKELCPVCLQTCEVELIFSIILLSLTNQANITFYEARKDNPKTFIQNLKTLFYNMKILLWKAYNDITVDNPQTMHYQF